MSTVLAARAPTIDVVGWALIRRGMIDAILSFAVILAGMRNHERDTAATSAAPR